MEIRHYLRILNHYKWVVLLTTILTVAVVAFATYRMTPTYTASSLLRVAQPTSDVVTYSDLSYGERLIKTYAQVLKSRPFLEEASKRLGLHASAGELAGLIRVEAMPSTELIRITVSNREPEPAAAIANALGDLLIEQGQKLYTGEGKDALQILRDQLAAVDAQLARDRATLALADNAIPESPDASGLAAKIGALPLANDVPRDSAEASSLTAKIRAEEATYSMLLTQYEKARVESALRANSISVVEPARVPTRPGKPNVKQNLALAAAIGLFAGLGLAFLLENLTPTIHSADDLPAITKLELIGRIPKLRFPRRVRQRARALAVDAESLPAIEAFHALGARIFSRHSSPVPRTVVISSAEPEAGKSTITAYLGAALAQIGRQVIIVDGDQRRPCLHRMYHLRLAPGLLDTVLDRRVLERGLHSTRYAGLRVLTAGSPDADDTALWHGTMLPTVVNQLAAQADVVIWDTPPILVSVEATLLAPLAGLVLLVVTEDQTTTKQLDLAIEQLRQVGCEAPAIVYNKTKDRDYGYYYYRYGSRIRSKKADHRAVQQEAPQSIEGELVAEPPHVQEAPAWQEPVAELVPNALSMPTVQDTAALALPRRERGTSQEDTAYRPPGGVATSPAEKDWRSAYESFAQQDLSGVPLEYLFLDALRACTKPLPKPRGEEDVLCAWAIDADGREALVHVATCSAESYELWLDFLRDMVKRGLSVPVLAIAHGTSGVMRAVGEVFPNSLQQRCLSIRIREVDEEIPRSSRAEVMAMVQAAYYAPNPRLAERISADMLKLYAARYSSAMRLFRSDWETCVAYLRCPPAHHSRIRTTTLLRRSFVEERRRTIDSSPPEAEKGSLERVFALLWQSSQRWQGIRMGDAERQQLRLLRHELGLLDGGQETAKEQAQGRET